ncbi:MULTISPECIES: hypothetical protein [Candidatus Cardinium]|uniref:hypothetical protein n=1 Tax=Candidatus Cardinium TaxID=273135 RepID=UPI001FAA1F2F|nr:MULTISPECIES: hypothetical protein [Cardinium]
MTSFTCYITGFEYALFSIKHTGDMGILTLAYQIQKHSPTIQLQPSIIHKTEHRDQ